MVVCCLGTPGLAGAQQFLIATAGDLAGTYRFALCYPACHDSSTVVGTGMLVIAPDSIIIPLDSVAANATYERSIFILRRYGHRSSARPPRGRANACFSVTAKKKIGDREYYPSIMPEGLTVLGRSNDGRFIVMLYGSPDASFHTLIRFDTPGTFVGVGIQHDWNDGGSPGWLGTVEGRRTGPPDPRYCFWSTRPDEPPLSAWEFTASPFSLEDDSTGFVAFLGRPDSVTTEPNPFVPQDAPFQEWYYRDIRVFFSTPNVVAGLVLLSPRFATMRGLRVGDPEARVLQLYGPRHDEDPAGEWEYAAADDSTMVMRIHFKDRHVVMIELEQLLD